MNPFLLLFLIIIANLCLYWIFFGKKRFDARFGQGILPDNLLDMLVEQNGFEKKIGEHDGGQNISR